MYRYFIFGFAHYCPSGGIKDIVHKANEKQEVKNFVKMWATEYKGENYENLHVYDSKEDKVIYAAEFDVHDYFDKNARELIVERDELQHT